MFSWACQSFPGLPRLPQLISLPVFGNFCKSSFKGTMSAKYYLISFIALTTRGLQQSYFSLSETFDIAKFFSHFFATRHVEYLQMPLLPTEQTAIWTAHNSNQSYQWSAERIRTICMIILHFVFTARNNVVQWSLRQFSLLSAIINIYCKKNPVIHMGCGAGEAAGGAVVPLQRKFWGSVPPPHSISRCRKCH